MNCEECNQFSNILTENDNMQLVCSECLSLEED